jgi:predicted metal-dependent hydrolase
MVRKTDKIATYLDNLPLSKDGQQQSETFGNFDRRYWGYFHCFERQQFYEAHDVLEDLWLKEGRSGRNYAFYKGLIQLAGAFVHLQKDRLSPAIALFRLAEKNLSQYESPHEGLNLSILLQRIEAWRESVNPDQLDSNPLKQGQIPVIPRPGEE